MSAPPSSSSSSKGLITLDELIGDTSILNCECWDFPIRGLTVSYWIYTHPTLTKDQPPIFCLHGGPAFTHNYILPLKLLTLRTGVPTIFYDQAGCGDSSRALAGDPAKDFPHLLTVDYYVEELLALLAHVRSTGAPLTSYYVYGSSWGSMLAQEFAIHLSKTGAELGGASLLGLVLDGALCDGEVYIKTQWEERIATLPTFTQRLLRKLEDEKDYGNPKYQVRARKNDTVRARTRCASPCALSTFHLSLVLFPQRCDRLSIFRSFFSSLVHLHHRSLSYSLLLSLSFSLSLSFPSFSLAVTR